MTMDVRVKRIIDGITYNTETSTMITGSANLLPNEHFQGEYLYQTRFGAFFLHRIDGKTRDEEAKTLIPQSRDQARAWLEKRPKGAGAHYIKALFGETPEAGSPEVGSEESRFTLRMPESLRDRLAAAAEANNQSLNAWIVRCLERCADGEAIYTAASQAALWRILVKKGILTQDEANEAIGSASKNH